MRRQRFKIAATVPAGASQADAARFIVQEIVNHYLDDSTSCAMVYNARTGRFENHIQPRSLLGALWVQFTESLNPARTYKECPHCGRRFAVSPDTKRRDSAYCSTKCRVAAYEKRKRKARDLRQQGMTIEAIAEEVDSEPQTVKGWVAGARRGHRSIKGVS
jgi:hypothetical protein